MDALDLFSEDLDRPLTAKSPPGSASSRRSGGQLGKHSRRSTPHTPSTGRSRVLAVDEVDIEKEGKVAEPVEDGKQDHDDGAGHKERDEDDVESPGPRTTSTRGSTSRDIALNTLSPPVRFYSHVHLHSSLDAAVMLLAKSPDDFPWSGYFRHAVLVRHKIPKPPYFDQLPSGERPDTLVLYGIPAVWFLDDDDDDVGQPQDDRLYNFTQRGNIVIKAACMRFGGVKSVDLLFEMVSRDEETSLSFDAYIQFQEFEGFSTAYFHLANGVLVDDRTNAQVPCKIDFDRAGHFNRQNRRLREARRQLAKEQRERAEKMAKVQAQKQRRAAKEQHAKLMKEFNRYRDRLEAVGGHALEVSDLDHVVDAVEETGRLLNACGEFASMEQPQDQFRQRLQACKTQLVATERLVDKEVAVSKLRVPALLDGLRSFENATYFTALVEEQIQMHGAGIFEGKTIFVSNRLFARAERHTC
jgi:hypothetical protein